MALAFLYLILALVEFVGATVVATPVMGRVQARRGGPRRGSVDAATVYLLRRRRQRLDRRLGIDPGGTSDQPALPEVPGGGAGAS